MLFVVLEVLAVGICLETRKGGGEGVNCQVFYVVSINSIIGNINSTGAVVHILMQQSVQCT